MPTLKQLEKTMGDILRNAVANAVVGSEAAAMAQEERDERIGHLEGHTKVSLEMLRECLNQASAEGAMDVHRSLHAQPGVDSNMLDEAVEYAPSGDDE